MTIFSHRHAYSDSLYYPISIRVIDPIYSQAILPASVTLFPSVLMDVTNTGSKTVTTLHFVQLNGEYAGESFMSLRFIVIETCGKLMISQKFEL